ncbi:MAG: crossover junction endodeoxyribonuclease RuvC [bacterium]|nr:crossover junction endodeoxyribonuclease RuvC [bacterium]
MRIMGIDPGKATSGFGIIETNGDDTFKLVHMGLVETSKDMEHGQRLDMIFNQFTDLLDKFQPQVVAIERLFFATNALTAIDVGQAIGVIKLAVYQSHVPIFDYAPMQVKLVVGGSGKADKKVMKQKIKTMFHIREKKGMRTHFDNTADALAIAICHARKASV